MGRLPPRAYNPVGVLSQVSTCYGTWEMLLQEQRCLPTWGGVGRQKSFARGVCVGEWGEFRQVKTRTSPLGRNATPRVGSVGPSRTGL